MAAGDSAGVMAIAFQFQGTRVACDAHRWLGDRALSAGEFVEAVDHYRKGLSLAAADEPLRHGCDWPGAVGRGYGQAGASSCGALRELLRG